MDNAPNFFEFQPGEGGFRSTSQEQLEMLQKALETSYDRYNQSGGQAMVPESLERTLISTTFSEKHLCFWNDIPKKKAYSTVEEYTTLDSYGGGSIGSGFFSGGGLPMETDLDAARRYALVKYLGTTRGITHPMTQVNSLAGPGALAANNAEEKETLAGTRWLLRQLEWALYWGNAATMPQSINGIEASVFGTDMANVKSAMQGTNRNIIDMRGANITDETLNEAAQVIVDNYGYPTKMYLSNYTLTDLSNYLAEQKRVLLNGLTNVNLGTPTTAFRSNFGDITYRNSLFLRNEERTAPGAGTHSKAPIAPVLNVAGITTPAAAAGDATKFGADDAGDYIYKITAFNPSGESAPLVTDAVVVHAGDKVSIPVDHAGSPWSDPAHLDGVSGFRVYRSAKGGDATTCRFLFEVAVNQAAGAIVNPTTIIDLNWLLPGTARSFVCDMSPDESISTKVLTPLLKWPLAIIDTRIRWSLLLYLSDVILYAPKKHVEIINIGRYQRGA